MSLRTGDKSTIVCGTHCSISCAKSCAHLAYPFALLDHLYTAVAHSMLIIGQPNLEQDMSETSTLPGGQDAVRTVLILTVARHR